MFGELVEKLEDRSAALRELAQCRIVQPKYREALNAAADLYDARAANMSRKKSA
ncbi:MAG: hypothetical protein MK180_18980 [Rhodobacteraceae bacterium]|nr:hypothetical protein [Paracoccaceae bacterium]